MLSKADLSSFLPPSFQRMTDPVYFCQTANLPFISNVVIAHSEWSNVAISQIAREHVPFTLALDGGGSFADVRCHTYHQTLDDLSHG